MCNSSHKKYLVVFVGLFILALLLSACSASSSDSEKESIVISGAFALYPLGIQWGQEYQALHPDVQFDITAGGAGKGMSDTLSGMVDIGMVSRDLKQEELDQGAFAIAVAKDAVFPVINVQNPYYDQLFANGLSKEVLNKIYITGEITTWGEALGDPQITESIHVYTRSDSSGAAEMWAKFVGGSAQEELKGTAVSGDPSILDAVIRDPLGIGYNNLNYLFDPETGNLIIGSAILPLDINCNGAIEMDEQFTQRKSAVEAVADGRYPSPPARELYFVTRGKPSGTLSEFIEWVLTDGQQFTEPTGFIRLPEEKLSEELAKLK